VVTPAILLADLPSVVPRRTVDQGAQEVGHESKLGDPSHRGNRTWDTQPRLRPVRDFIEIVSRGIG
jgi:hypothetical protein